MFERILVNKEDVLDKWPLSIEDIANISYQEMAQKLKLTNDKLKVEYV